MIVIEWNQSSHLDLGDGMGDGETALLDNSAAKHKMAIRPQRKRRSESRNRDITSTTDVESSVSSVEQQSKKIKPGTEEITSTEVEKVQQSYRRTRSGRQMVADPAAKREYVTYPYFKNLIKKLVSTEN